MWTRVSTLPTSAVFLTRSLCRTPGKHGLQLIGRPIPGPNSIRARRLLENDSLRHMESDEGKAYAIRPRWRAARESAAVDSLSSGSYI